MKYVRHVKNQCYATSWRFRYSFHGALQGDFVLRYEKKDVCTILAVFSVFASLQFFSALRSPFLKDHVAGHV